MVGRAVIHINIIDLLEDSNAKKQGKESGQPQTFNTSLNIPTISIRLLYWIPD